MRVVELKYQEFASKPQFDTTEDTPPDWADGEWGRPSLEDFPVVDGDENWDDLDAAERQDVADHFIDGTADASEYAELSYPVVNPATGRLNRNGVLAARQRASAENDSEVLAVANDLWEEHFTDEDEEQSLGISVTRRKVGGNRTAKQAEPQELSVNGSRPPAYFEGSLSEIDDPTSETMRLINEQSDIELGPDDVVVFEDYVAHDQPPSVGARVPLGFSLDALEKLAEDAREGRTFNLHHNKPRPVGSTFDAEIVRDEVNGIAGNWLKLSWYSPTKDASEQRRQDIADMSTGVLKHTSIETRYGRWERREMDPSDQNDSRQWFEIQDNPEADETDRLILEGAARVHLGAITGAGSS